jgi:hypothetical protein
MKTTAIIIPLLLLAGLAAVIVPGSRDRGPPAYHMPQQQHMWSVSKALLIFEHENGRRVRDYAELQSYVNLRGIEVGVTKENLVFTTPTGVKRNWRLYPVIDGTEYLLASPIFDWHGETQRLAYRLTGNGGETILLGNSKNET